MIGIEQTMEMPSQSVTKMSANLPQLAHQEKRLKDGSAKGSLERIEMHSAALEVRIQEFGKARELLHERAAEMVHIEQKLFESEMIEKAKTDAKITDTKCYFSGIDEAQPKSSEAAASGD